MTWSLNEIEALARKATRGAGYSWGLAEDTGRAVRWLEARALPGAAVLAAHLAACDGQDLATYCPETGTEGWVAPNGTICPILAGTMLADGMTAGESAPLTLSNLRNPLLLLPFLALMAETQGRAVGVKLDGTAITLSATGDLTASAPIPAPEVAPLTLRFDAAPQAQTLPAALRSGCHLDSMAALTGFASRTYAPATEESRLAGAGAGLSDND